MLRRVLLHVWLRCDEAIRGPPTTSGHASRGRLVGLAEDGARCSHSVSVLACRNQRTRTGQHLDSLRVAGWPVRRSPWPTLDDERPQANQLGAWVAIPHTV